MHVGQSIKHQGSDEVLDSVSAAAPYEHRSDTAYLTDIQKGQLRGLWEAVPYAASGRATSTSVEGQRLAERVTAHWHAGVSLDELADVLPLGTRRIYALTVWARKGSPIIRKTHRSERRTSVPRVQPQLPSEPRIITLESVCADILVLQKQLPSFDIQLICQPRREPRK